MILDTLRKYGAFDERTLFGEISTLRRVGADVGDLPTTISVSYGRSWRGSVSAGTCGRLVGFGRLCLWKWRRW